MEAHLCVRNNDYLIFVRNFQKNEPERRSGAFRSNSNPGGDGDNGTVPIDDNMVFLYWPDTMLPASTVSLAADIVVRNDIGLRDVV